MADAGENCRSDSDPSSGASGADALLFDALARFLARGAFVFFCLLILVLGAWVAGAGFHDPDTCWLLALGRIIFEQRALPTADPFSFTFAAVGEKPFVLYQWLTELLLFLSYKWGGLVGVLSLVALAVHVAFVVLPLVVFERLGLSRFRSFVMITLALASASFHLLVRPEIFSYLMLSLWLALMLRIRIASRDRTELDWTAIALMSVLMVLWCNLHTGFTSGLIVLVLYVVFGSLQWVLTKRRGAWPYLTACVTLFSTLLATLINPIGIGLWQYLPRLFFGQFNKTIVELQPLGLNDLKSPVWYPFYFLVLVALLLVWRVFRRARQTSPELLYSFVLIAVLAYLGFSCRRLIPFNALVLIYECAWLRAALPTRQPGLLALGADKLKQMFKVDATWIAFSTALMFAGLFLIATGPVKPQLPQSSSAFAYPGEVLEYMREHPPVGCGFNAPQLGDVLIWQLHPCPRIFIDTRFDMYGAKPVNDYRSIAACQPGWQAALDRYRCDWAFVSSEDQLANALKLSSQWKLLVRGQTSLYFVRNRSLL